MGHAQRGGRHAIVLNPPTSTRTNAVPLDLEPVGGRYHPNESSCGSMLEVTCGRTCGVEGGWSHSEKPWEECWNGLMKIKACGRTVLYNDRGSTRRSFVPKGL